MTGVDPTLLDLADYRRRTAELYAEVRRGGPAPSAWDRWREERDTLFVTHPQTPLEPDSVVSFTGLTYYPHDPSWRVVATVEWVEADPADVSHSAQGHTRLRPFATAAFSRHEQDHQLTLYWLEAYGGGVFLPFRDATSGTETYGGGRYLLDTVKGADLGGDRASIVLDFNYAYHPSCVHSDRWSCPLAPPANHLQVPVRAGERLAG